MGSTEKTQRTYDLKLNLHCNCEGCAKKVRDIVLEIEGVVSIDIDKDLKLGKATVSGNVSPQTVIEKLKDKGKPAELLGKEVKKERPQQMKDQKIQNVPHNPAQRKGNPQPPNLEKAIHDGNPKHDHEYELKSYKKPFKCDKCREDGFTSGYRCKHCIFDLHKVCLNPKPERTHVFFSKSNFKIVREPVRRKNCDACGKEIHGHFYSCEENGLDLHPACSELPGELPISGTDFVLCKNFKYECFCCKKKRPCWFAKTQVKGLCYVAKRAKISCHVGCLPLVMEEAWKRGGRKSDRNNDSISKAPENMDVKPVANAKGSSALFLHAVTILIIIGVLFGDPSSLIVAALKELVKEFF